MTPMDSSTSSFSEVEQSFPDAELLQVGGTTCECYRVKLYGKLHFLKRLKPELRTHPQYAAALQKEFELGYPLEHPHLVRYTAKTPDGILMEYVDGETLSQFAEHHPDYFAKREQADRFLQQLLSVVGYLHSHQIVHLDLKPGNILITRIGHDVKLIDLGYSYADCYTDTTGHTDKYAAPEQKYGTSRVDARTDIYAIGRILQTLPCAHYYNKVIKRCTEEQMYLRYSSIDELRRAVSPRRNHRWILAVIVMVIVFLAGFLLYRQAYHAPVSPDEATTVLQPEQDSMAVKESPTSSNPEITDRATTYELPPVSPPVEPPHNLEPRYRHLFNHRRHLPSHRRHLPSHRRHLPSHLRERQKEGIRLNARTPWPYVADFSSSSVRDSRKRLATTTTPSTIM